jgi:hypothetical protein
MMPGGSGRFGLIAGGPGFPDDHLVTAYVLWQIAAKLGLDKKQCTQVIRRLAESFT